MAKREDLGVQYAKNMAHFGCGVAMFQPVSAADMRPPCVGYIDGNNRWDFIANVEWVEGHGQRQGNTIRVDANESGYQPLDRKPMKSEQLGIEWRPRTSIGVRQWTVDANGNTPNVGLPIGADAHIKYKSNTSFGAVLIAQKPITLTTYNDETLFYVWLRTNSPRLSALHGRQLRRHGLWLVTRTYTTPRASINAWDAKDKDANMSVKAKANMMGDLGGDLEWVDKNTDKDWSHYTGQNGEAVVVFFDGIEVPAYKWWWENVKIAVGCSDVSRQGSPNRVQKCERPHTVMPVPRRSDELSRQPSEEVGLLVHDLLGSEISLRRENPFNGRNISRGQQAQSRPEGTPARNSSTPPRLSKYLKYEPHNQPTYQITGRPLPNPNGGPALAKPQGQCFSTASTVTSSFSAKARNAGATTFETSPLTSLPRNALQRKAGSPSLRQSS